MSSPIDLANKHTLSVYIDTMVVEAARNQGLGATEEYNNADITLRPYLHPMPHAFDSRINAFFSTVVSTGLALFSRKQSRAATHAFELSERYLSAAHPLQFGWHGKVIEIDNPIARISRKVFDLSTHVKDIDSMRKREATNYSNCGLFGLFGSGVLGIGIYTSAQWLKTLGKIALSITAVFYLYTWVTHRGDQKKIQDIYGQVGKLGETIRYDLTYYDDEMKLKKADSVYTPLYPTFQDLTYKPTLEKVDDIVYTKAAYERKSATD